MRKIERKLDQDISEIGNISMTLRSKHRVNITRSWIKLFVHNLKYFQGVCQIV
jgi:hypothetical protein